MNGLSVADIAQIWNVPPNRVYWLAHKHQWRRFRSSGKTFYHPHDVLETMD